MDSPLSPPATLAPAPEATRFALLSVLRAVGRVALAALPYVLTAVAVIAIGLPTVILPFWSDTAIFAVIGQAIARGGMPYVDAWDQKPPAIYLIYAAATQGPWDLFLNVRVLDLGWTALTSVLLVELGRRWWSVRAGMVAGVLYGGVYFTISGWWQLAQPDSFIGLPLVLALLMQTTARGRWPWLVLAGCALGFAFQLRAIMALLIPVYPLADALGAQHGRLLRAWLWSLIWLGVGFTVFQAVLASGCGAAGRSTTTSRPHALPRGTRSSAGRGRWGRCRMSAITCRPCGSRS